MYGPDDDLSIKRRALLGAVASVTGGTAGCFDDTGNRSQDDMGTGRPPPCQIDWHPDALAPVFWGWQDYGKEDGAPGPTRVFYPSLDGSPPRAPILECGYFLLILFAHGECEEDIGENYKTWNHLPATLARAGYVVAVPEIPWDDGSAPKLDIRMDRMNKLVDWMYGSWEHRKWLFGEKSSIGVAGHSWGALLMAYYAARNDVMAHASIGGPWTNHHNTLEEVKKLEIPKIFCWGRKRRELMHSTLAEWQWDSIAKPKHKAVFKLASHWDFLPAGRSTCALEEDPGPCSQTPYVTTELTVMFFGKYLPASERLTSDDIPATLIRPELELPEIEKTEELGPEHYASTYLTDFYFEDSNCQVELTWNTGTKSGTKTVTG